MRRVVAAALVIVALTLTCGCDDRATISPCDPGHTEYHRITCYPIPTTTTTTTE